MARTSSCLSAAVAYALRGWQVFPLHNVTDAGDCSCGNPHCSDPGKHPRTAHGLKDGTTDLGTIANWYQTWPDANVAIVTGQSSGLVVLDVDPDDGGSDTLHDLETRHGALPTTIEAITGGGGRHLLFAAPAVPVRNSVGKNKGLGSGLDIRADGGYIVAAPSNHSSGRRYEWDSGRHPDDTPLADLPQWLLGMLAVAATSPKPPAASSTTIPAGQRNSRLASIAGSMRRQGADEPAILAALRQINADQCAPPLPDADVQKVAASISTYPPAPVAVSATVVDSPSRPVEVARQYLAQCCGGDVPRLAHWRGGYYAWNGASWDERDDGTVRADLYHWLEHASYETVDDATGHSTAAAWNPNRQKVAAVQEALSAVAHVPDEAEERSWIVYDGRWRLDPTPPVAPGTVIIALGHGLLCISPDGDASPGLGDAIGDAMVTHGISGATRGKSPLVTRGDATKANCISNRAGYFNFSHVELQKESDASPRVTSLTNDSRCPKRWLEFLDSVWPGDCESAALLQEWFGYVLGGETRMQKMLLFVGPPRSGKGTVARILGALVGKRHTASPTMASLVSPFGMQSLIGKTLAIVADARFGGRDTVIAVERLLSISGEDWQTVDRKYKPSWTGKIGARFMLLSNELPKLGDVSGAIATRFVILQASRSWLGSEDLGLDDALRGELGGILEWSLEGLRRLLRQRRFTEPGSARETAQALMDYTSPMRAFVREKLIIGDGYETPTMAAYQAWRNWCQDQGRDTPGTAQAFGRDIRAAVPGVVTYAKGHGGAEGRWYRGMRLRTPEDTDDAPPIVIAPVVPVEMFPPRVGDAVWCLSADGQVQNAVPWAIARIEDGPDGEQYAMFEESPGGWPLRQCEKASEAA